MSGLPRALFVCFVFFALETAATACTLSLAIKAEYDVGRIASLNLTVRHGAISALGHVPVGWRLVVDNDPSWMAKVSGQAIVGAAFLEQSEFSGLFFIEPEPGYTCSTLRAQKFVALRLTLYHDDSSRDLRPAIILSD